MPSSRRLQQWLASASGPSLLISQNDPRRLDAGVPVGARWPAGLPAWLAALPPQRLAGLPTEAVGGLVRQRGATHDGIAKGEGAGLLAAVVDAPDGVVALHVGQPRHARHLQDAGAIDQAVRHADVAHRAMVMNQRGEVDDAPSLPILPLEKRGPVTSDVSDGGR
jgi:hypothetical protein